MIPASLLIIALPVIAAALALALRRWRTLEVLIALVACGAIIVLLARPSESVIALASAPSGLVIDLDGSLNLLGRVLQVRLPDRLPLLVIFAAAAIIFAFSWRDPQGWTFVPVGLVVLAAMSAGLMIRPFVYAALAFEAAAALGALMIQAERNGERTTLGATRYLIAFTLALPLFLGAGYLIDQANASGLSDPEALEATHSTAIILLVVGFGLMVGALPLISWIPAVARDAPPLTTAFLGTVAAGAVCFLMLSLWQEFEWFRTSATTANAMKIGGVALLIFGGALAWAQNSFSRVLACGVMVEIGCNLLGFATYTPMAIEAFAFAILARAISLGLLCVGITRLRSVCDAAHFGSHFAPHLAAYPAANLADHFDEVRGCGLHHLPIALALAVGGLSLAGLPGTLGFVSRWISVRAIGATDVEALVLVVVASASVAIGIMRGLLSLFSLPRPTPSRASVLTSMPSPLETPRSTPTPTPTSTSTSATTHPYQQAPVAERQAVIDDDQLPLYSEQAVAIGEIHALSESGDLEELEIHANDVEPKASFGAQFTVAAGVALVLILGVLPGIIAMLAQAVAAGYTFYR